MDTRFSQTISDMLQIIFSSSSQGPNESWWLGTNTYDLFGSVILGLHFFLLAPACALFAFLCLRKNKGDFIHKNLGKIAVNLYYISTLSGFLFSFYMFYQKYSLGQSSRVNFELPTYIFFKYFSVETCFIIFVSIYMMTKTVSSRTCNLFLYTAYALLFSLYTLVVYFNVHIFHMFLVLNIVLTTIPLLYIIRNLQNFKTIEKTQLIETHRLTMISVSGFFLVTIIGIIYTKLGTYMDFSHYIFLQETLYLILILFSTIKIYKFLVKK